VKVEGFEKLKKSDTYLVDYNLATDMVRSMHAETTRVEGSFEELAILYPKDTDKFVYDKTSKKYKFNVPKPAAQIVKAFWGTYRWTLLFNYFAKSEAYYIPDRKTKTRGIASRGTNSDLLFQTFLTPYLDNMQNIIQQPHCYYHEGELHGNTMNALKTSVFHGTFELFFERMIDLKKLGHGSAVIMVYSDNINIFFNHKDKIYAAEMDFVKAESSVKWQTVKLAAKHVLSSYPEVSRGWLLIGSEIYPTYATRGVALYGTHQIPYPLLGSGTPGTHYLNEVNSVLTVARAVEIAQKKNHKLQPFIEWHEESGIFKEHPIIKEAMEELGVKCELEEQPAEVKPLAQGGFYEAQIIRVGFLGFDMLPVAIDEVETFHFAILRKERLLKAVFLHKNNFDADGKPTKDMLTTAFVTLAKMRSLMFVGAWAYEALRRVLWKKATQALNILKRAKAETMLRADTQGNLKAFFGEFGIPEEISNALSALSSEVALPTLYDIFYLHTNDKDKTRAAMRYRLNIIPMAHLMNSEQAKSMGLEATYETATLNVTNVAPEEMSYNPVMVENTRGARIVYKRKDLLSDQIDLKIEHPTDILSPSTTQARADVGRPIVPKMPKLPPLPHIPTVNILSLLNDFDKDPEGYYMYRVPVPGNLTNRMSDIRNEFKVASNLMIKLLAKQTGMTEANVTNLLLPYKKRVCFFIRPTGPKTKFYDATSLTGDEEFMTGKERRGDGTREKPYFSIFDVSNLALVPDKILPQRELSDRRPEKPGESDVKDANLSDLWFPHLGKPKPPKQNKDDALQPEPMIIEAVKAASGLLGEKQKIDILVSKGVSVNTARKILKDNKSFQAAVKEADKQAKEGERNRKQTYRDKATKNTFEPLVTTEPEITKKGPQKTPQKTTKAKFNDVNLMKTQGSRGLNYKEKT
jgi:hypothetical protein